MMESGEPLVSDLDLSAKKSDQPVDPTFDPVKTSDPVEPSNPVEESNGTNGNAEGENGAENHSEEAATEQPKDAPADVGSAVAPEEPAVDQSPAEEDSMDVDKPAETETAQPIEPETSQPDENDKPEPMEAEKSESMETEEPETTEAADETIKPESTETEKADSAETDQPKDEEKPEAETSAAEKVEGAVDESAKTDESESQEPAKPVEISPFDALMSEGETKKEEKKEDGNSDKPTEEKPESDEQMGETKEDESADKSKSADEKKEKEVFEVEDDGKEIAPKIEPTPDEEYFAGVDPEELDWYKEHVQDYNKKIQCTSCFKQITPEINAHSGIFRHPLLGVGICKPCNNYLNDGEWTKDEDGCDMFCRWCGQGGDIIICDKCPHAFCKKCLQRNLGRKCVSEISSSEEWKCLVCDPKQIYELRALYYALFTHQQELQAKKSVRKEGAARRKSSLPSAAGDKEDEVVAEGAADDKKISFSAENFLDENFEEVLKTFAEFQKTVDEEKGRWIEANRELNPEIATTITRKLRKFYSVTKQNLEVLDRALASAYVSKYPEEAKRIHMGKDDEVIDAETEYGGVKKSSPKKKQTPKKFLAPIKKVATPKKKILPKKKVLEAKKKKAVEAKASTSKAPVHKIGPKSKVSAGSKSRPAPRSAKRSAAPVSNGAGSSSKSYVTPSLMGGAKKKAAPTKVSAKLFKAKKRPATTPATVDSDESDIEILDEDVQPPAAKKPRPGPKSRTR